MGLAAHLIGIEGADQIATHPLRGALFENMVVVEALKYRLNRGRSANLSFFRDSRGLECDLVLEGADGRVAIEMKAGATIPSDAFSTLDAVAQTIPDVALKAVVYGGRDRQSRSTAEVVPFDELSDALERIELGREIAAFAQATTVPEPSETDPGILDGAYSKHIRPIVAALGNAFGDLKTLFRGIDERSTVEFNGSSAEGRSVLAPDGWEHTKNSYIVGSGFDLSDQNPLTIRHRISLDGYLHGRMDFNVVISCIWMFDADSMSRSFAIDNEPLDEFGTERIGYSELAVRSARIARVCAMVLRQVRKAIEARA